VGYQGRQWPLEPTPIPQSATVHVLSTRNNTILTLVGADGKPRAWESAGSAGFKNARKSSSFAAEAAAQRLAAKAVRLGLTVVEVKMKGLGQGKMGALKVLNKSGLVVTKIWECTPVPHNGCRPPARRRI
jgi:small subunit ribosomal protein S11